MTTTQTHSLECALCHAAIKHAVYRDQERIFCCAGCQAVHQIILTQGALDNFQEHPVFKQAVRSGLISNPDLVETDKNEGLAREEIQKLHLEIQEMWCPSCAKVIRLILMREKGIQHCAVDYSTDLASIEYAPRYISKEKIMKFIQQLGYCPIPLQDPRQSAISRSLSLRFIVAAFFSLNVMMLAYPIYASYFHSEKEGYTELFAWLSLAGSLPVLLYSAWPIWRRFFIGLRVGIWGMEALVLLGVLAATGLSIYEMLRGTAYVYFDSMSVIIVFMLLGKIIESKAKFSAKDSLIQLMRALPRRGRKKEADGTEHFVSLKEIQLGDEIVVLAGEKIVVDGVVVEGNGTCDESVMTGESLPIVKNMHAKVLSGTVLQQGRLVIKVATRSDETALHRIIDMVSRDIEHKSQYVRAADHIVRWFVPAVIVLAVCTALVCWLWNIQDPGYTTLQTAIVRAVSILLISCPCAIGIAAPLAEAHILNALAKLGVIVRNRGCLAFLGRETAFVFDKTGTLTEGKFIVLSGLEALSFAQQVCLKSLTAYSNHPIASTIHRSILTPLVPMQGVEELIGKGLKGKCEGQTYYLGSLSFLQEQGVAIHQEAEEQSKDLESCVFFACDQICLTRVRLGDRIRPDAKEVIQSLADIKTFLVSGDTKAPVQSVARQCGIKEWHAQCHPLQKRAFIEQLRQQGHLVAMMGDGINDAPALTAAHVGIAVVSATDLSIQVSDLLLTTDRLTVLSQLKTIAHQGHRIIKQNLFWAFFYNVMGIPLAMTGWLSPIFAAFAMILSSLIVLFNAQRIGLKKG